MAGSLVESSRRIAGRALRTTALAAVALAGAAGAAGQAEVSGRPYLGPDGEPLPFASDDEVLDFLRTAEVVDRSRIGRGINNPERLVLERDGVRARATWRVVSLEVRNRRVGKDFYFLFRDEALHECAAYLVSRVFELGLVPPVVPRKIGAQEGTLQLWMEDVTDESMDSFRPKDPLEWARQVGEMKVFDNLVGNVDRNPGNLLVDRNQVLWLIDHTRAFQVETSLVAPEGVRSISRRAWKRLNEVTEEELREAGSRYLAGARLGSGQRFRAFQERRRKIVEILQGLIAEHGEGSVLYDWRSAARIEPRPAPR